MPEEREWGECRLCWEPLDRHHGHKCYDCNEEWFCEECAVSRNYLFCMVMLPGIGGINAEILEREKKFQDIAPRGELPF